MTPERLAPPGRRADPSTSPVGPAATWPGTLVLLLVSLVGVMAFTWPFFVDPRSGLAHGTDAPWLFAVLMSLLGVSLLAEQSSGRLDAKTVAVLGVLAALGGCLRLLSAGTAGLEPVFFLVVVAGRVLGGRLAFLAGALILLLGAFLTGGIGPWAPFQMIASGWIALGAAVLPALRGRAELVMLAAYGLIAGLLYGVVMNLWFWPFIGSGAPAGAGFVPGADPVTNLGRYAVFYLATSLGWDLPRAVLTCLLVAVAGPAALATLRRAVRAAAFEETGQFR
ncbi:MAG TPA: ECF transporter S component [Dermatophilaceae bacterium]|nr:ECF transporter S component [Dermatophilaceae bacterium]